ncbi:MAG: hypothetical protein ABW186_05185 [Rhodanobacteraceae bacterium]
MRLELGVDFIRRLARFFCGAEAKIELGKLEPGLIIEASQLCESKPFRRLRGREPILEFADSCQRVRHRVPHFIGKLHVNDTSPTGLKWRSTTCGRE